MANGLGRGLGSLIPNKAKENSNIKQATASSSKDEHDKILNVDIGKIETNPLQPRKDFNDAHLNELIESIKDYGVIQPLIVSKKAGVYELIAGERRLRASKKAGLDKVPVIVRDASRQEKLEVALIENIQRENLNPIELATAYQQLSDEFDLNQVQVAKRLGKSRSTVANIMRMLNLPDEIQRAIAQSKISEGHAKYIMGLETQGKQLNVFRKIIHNNLTIQETDKIIKKMGGTKDARIKINYADKDKEFAFREFFGAKTEVRRKGKGGQIIMDFYSDEELKEIVDKIK